MITLDLNHFGFQRAGRPERRRRGEREKGRGEVPNPGPTSMVVSWNVRMHRAPTRVVSKGGGLQARANLNGGELDKEPFLRDKRSQRLLHGCKGGRQKRMLSPRTDLNGGERKRACQQGKMRRRLIVTSVAREHSGKLNSC